MHRVPILCFVALLFVPNGAWAQGEPLGPEFQVNSYTTDQQSRPSVAAASGNFVVVWDSAGQDGSNNGVFGQRYSNAGVPLDAEFRVNTYTTGRQANPSVAATPSGFVVVWRDYDQDSVFGQRYSTAGALLGPEFQVNSNTSSVALLPSVAADPVKGDFVVVWPASPGLVWGVFGQRYAASGTPLGTEFFVGGWSEYPNPSASTAVDAVGNFVVVWTGSGPPLGTTVYGQRFASSGAPLGSQFRVNTFSTGDQKNPSVAADSSGNFVVVWSGPDYGSGHAIFGQRFAASGMPLGPEFRVSTYSGFQDLPAVASESSGNFVVTWEDLGQDGSDRGIFGQRYASSGAPLGAEFRVNTFTTGRQDHSTVAADDFGNFVVVWTSADQDGSSDGVFGQRYSQIVPVELMHFRVE
jgi:hypothetical protein